MNSPYEYSELKEPNDEVFLQEVISYVKRDDKLLRITVKRNFFTNDYIDCMTVEVLSTGE